MTIEDDILAIIRRQCSGRLPSSPEAACRVAARLGLSVLRCPALDGAAYYDDGAAAILVSDAITPSEQLLALIHEIAEALLLSLPDLGDNLASGNRHAIAVRVEASAREELGLNHLPTSHLSASDWRHIWAPRDQIRYSRPIAPILPADALEGACL